MATGKFKPIPALSQKDINRFNRSVDRSKGASACWPWTGCHQRGKGIIRLHGRNYYVPRIAYFLATGKDPGQLDVCHDCPDGDNPLCCNGAHHWLGTDADNMHDKRDKGRSAKGESHGRSKLTVEDIRYARNTYAAGGVTYKSLATDLNVTPVLIGYIIRGEIWTHV